MLSGGVFRYLPDLLMQLFPQLRVQGPKRPHQRGLPRNHVPVAAGLQFPHAQHMQRPVLGQVRHQDFQTQGNLSRRQEGRVAQLRIGPMPAPAGHLDKQLVR